MLKSNNMKKKAQQHDFRKSVCRKERVKYSSFITWAVQQISSESLIASKIPVLEQWAKPMLFPVREKQKNAPAFLSSKMIYLLANRAINLYGSAGMNIEILNKYTEPSLYFVAFLCNINKMLMSLKLLRKLNNNFQETLVKLLETV